MRDNSPDGSHFIADEIKKEEEKFRKTLKNGLKEFEKQDAIVYVGSHVFQGINGQRAFDLFTTFGFPIELTIELAKEKVGAKRLIEPGEIANIIYFVAQNPVINGSVIHANLGQLET